MLVLKTGVTIANEGAGVRHGAVLKGQRPSLWVLQSGVGVILRGVDRRYNLRGERLPTPRGVNSDAKSLGMK